MSALRQSFPVFKHVATVDSHCLPYLMRLLQDREIGFAVLPATETSPCFAGLYEVYGRLDTNDAAFIRCAIADTQGTP